MTFYLILFILIPLATAFILPLIRGKNVVNWIPDALALGTQGILALLALMTIGKTGVYHIGGWQAPIGIDLRLDGLTTLMLLVINIVALCLSIFAVPYMKLYTSKPRFFCLFLLLVAGVNGVVLTGDLFNLYLFMELASIASFALVGFGCEHDELEASFKYLVQGSIGSAFIFLGIALTYAMAGTLSLTDLSHLLPTLSSSPVVMFALVLFLVGFSIKAALVPFHAWLPDAHPSAPAPVSAMLSGVVIKTLGIYVLARLIFNVFGVTDNILWLLKVLGTLSMVIGVVLALAQWDMKRLYAYSSISQIGYIALGLGLGTPLGIIGALYHLVNHSVFKSLLFLTAGSVQYSTGTRNLKELGGLNKQMPVTGAASLIASMSISGIPPLNGFFSKLIIIVACIGSGHYVLGTIAALVSILTLTAVLKVQKHAFFKSLATTATQLRKTPLLMGTAMILLSLLCVGLSLLMLGGFSTPFIISQAAAVLVNGTLGN